MRFVWATARKDLARLATDPLAFAIWLGIPLLLGGLMTLAFGGRSGPKPKAHLLAADEDQSFLSQALVGAFGQEGLAEIVELETVERAAGEARLRAGEASALLIIPAGFGEAVVKNEPVTLTLVTNPAQRILPAILQELLSLAVEAGFYAQALVGEPVRRFQAVILADQPPTAEQVAELSIELHGVASRLEGTLFPPALELEIEVETEEEKTPPPSFGLLFLPGVLFMSLLFIAQGVAHDVWHEKRLGTLRRALVAPHTAAAFLAGKLAAGLVVIAAVAAVALGAAAAVYSLDPAALPLAFLWLLLSGALFVALFQLLHLVASAEGVAATLSNMVTFPLLMLGGSFFPFEAMPGWMVAIGRWTPNGWALVRLKEILGGAAAPEALALSGLALLLLAAALFALAARRLRGGFVLA